MKNTFVKLFLAVAMCFMIGSALVACGGDIDLGVNADGYITINDQVTDVKVSGNDVACKEHNVVVSVVKEHTADAAGVYLETCTLCSDYAKVVTDTKHDFEEGVKQAATCFVDAFEGQVCKICGARGVGKTEEGTAKHNWTKSRAIDLAANKSACTEGGVMIKSCDDCGLIDEPAYVTAVGHTADHWDVVSYPKVDEMGLASGKCIYCNGMFTYDLPAIYLEGEFNADAYSLEYVDGVAPTCTKASQAIYTYKVAEEQNATSKVWNTNLKFNVKEDAPATGHYLAGKKAEKWADENGVYPYFADVNGNGKVESKETLGITLFAGAALECGTSDEAGYYTCTACNEVEKVDFVFVDHNGPRTVKEVAKCYALGTDIVSCYICKKDREVDTEAEHNIVYDLAAYVLVEGDDEATKDVVETEYYKKVENIVKGLKIDKWVLTSYCDANVPVKEEEEEEEEEESSAVESTATKTIKCWEQDPSKVDAELIGKKVVKEFTGADLGLIKLQKVEPSTCYTAGYNQYQYIQVDSTDPEKKEYITVKVPLELAQHTLNGKTLDKYKTVTVDIEGITPFAANEFKTCGNWYDAYFTCSVCEKELKAGNTAVTTAIAKTSALKAHVFKYTPVEDAEATCTVDGKQEVICTYTGCGEDGRNWKDYADADPRIIPAFGHSYSYTPNISGTTLELTAVCSVCDDEGETAEPGHEVKHVDDKSIELRDFIAGETGEKIAELSCVSREITKYTVVLALDVKYQPETYFDDDPETEEDESEIVKTWKTITKVKKAELKDPDAKVKEYKDQYTFSVTFNVPGNVAPQGHKFPQKTDRDYEEKLIKRQIPMDWDKDGVVDQLVEYTYVHCPVCDLNELVGSMKVIEKYTDVTYEDYKQTAEE